MADNKGEYVSVRLYLPNQQFKRRFQAACVMLDRKMSDVAVELIEGWLSKNDLLELSQQYGQRTSPSLETARMPTIASALEETLSNRNWAIQKLAEDAEIPRKRIEQLLKGDRPSDTEIRGLAQVLIRPTGEAWEEGDLVDIRLAEDLKRRQTRR